MNDEQPICGDLYCEVCGDLIDVDTKYCPGCQEFVGGQTICAKCDGSGMYEERQSARESDIDERWKVVVCDECDGEGFIDA